MNEVLKFLEEKRIFSLWHFTAISNLPYIFEHNGLRSKKYLEEKGILEKIITGGNELSHRLDKGLDNWDKISLSFTPYTPMAYHKKQEQHLVFIEIDYTICSKEKNIFTDCNANRLKNGQKRAEGIEGLKNIRWEYISSDPMPWDLEWQKYVQAEALIPDMIPIEKFKSIHFVSKASMDFGKYLCYEFSNYFSLFKVSPEIFQDYKKKEYKYKKTIIFPYIQKVFVSLEEINSNNFDRMNNDSNFILKSKPFWIKIELFALSGTKVDIKFLDIEENSLYTESVSFKEENNWVWFPKIDFHKRISNNINIIFIEVWLENSKWFEKMVELK